jgi:hypothetical protein
MNPASKFVGSNWVAATHTRNFILNNCIADCIYELEKTPSSNYSNSSLMKNSSSINFIMEQGNIFEKKVIDELRRLPSLHSSDFVDLKGKARSVCDFEKTRDEMLLRKTPIILGGVLHDEKEKIFGCPDVLVRTDYLDKIFTNLSSYIDTEKSRRVEYAVIDIKFSTLTLMCDGLHILNSGFYPAYKAQVEIYRRIVNKICNTNYKYGFLLGRGIKYTTKGVNVNQYSRDKFFSPGVIDYGKKDLKFVKKTTEAIKWIKRLRSLKRDTLETLYTDPKTFMKKIPRVFPNMCYTNDFANIQLKKKEINEVVKDITQLWMCSSKHRELALSKTNGEVSSWEHPQFSTELINLKGKTKRCVNSILKVNRDPKNYTVVYDETLFSDKLPEKKVFIDFEVLADISADDSFSSPIIFMIGIAYENNREVISKTFSIDVDPTRALQELEKNMIHKFISYIYLNELETHAMVHWSPAENWQWVSVCKKIESCVSTSFKFFDLCKYFQNHAFAVNGCFNYGLKNIAKSLYQLGHIKSTWGEGCETGVIPSDGLEAVVNFYKAYRTKNSELIEREIRNIEKYNYIDVIVMYEICKFIESLY